jgi:arylsulfatase A-like enzyme
MANATNNTRRIGVIGLVTALLVPLTCLHCNGGNNPAARPNVLIITICSVRQDHMSCYGYARETTPYLNRLAREAIVFDNAFTQWPKTSPALAAIMTAKYGHSNGVLRIVPGSYLDDEHVTLAEVLKAAGYQTAAFLQSAATHREMNIAQGFDVVEEPWRGQRRDVLPRATGQALSWLQKRDSHKPFFVWVHYNNAHTPYVGGGAPPDTFVGDQYYDSSHKVRVFPSRRARLNLDIPRDHPSAMQILRPDVGGVHSGAFLRERPTEYGFYIARYDAGILGTDMSIAALLEGVRQMGLLNDTLVVVVGDHGESLGDHNYYFGHGRFAYDANLKVPLMIRTPGGAVARRVNWPVATFGIAPTVLELIDLPAPEEWEAKSLWPVANGGRGAEFVFSEAGYQFDYLLAVRDNRWKVIHVPNSIDRSLMQNAEYELYDWRNDPGETKNLAGQHPEQVRRLAGVLKEWSAPWVDAAYRRSVPKEMDVDEETLRELKALGYVGAVDLGDEGEDDEAGNEGDEPERP